MNAFIRAILLEKLKGWRTILFNVLTTLLAVVTMFSQESWVSIDPKLILICVMLISGMNIILRLITDTPVGNKT